MKVLITKCSDNDFWYKDKIGEVFEISTEKNWHHNFVTIENYGSIFSEDCHVIQSIATVLTEWDKNGGELQFWSKVSKKWGFFVTEFDTIGFTDILRIKPVEQPQYRPYTFEEAKEVFTKDAWVIDKQTDELLMVFRIKEDGVFLASCPKTEYNLLLSNFTHLDGSPCGVKIN